MQENDLVRHLRQFLATLPVKKLCRSYHAEPEEAMGELYLGLFKLANDKEIRQPIAWISRNGMGLLKNHMRREYLCRL